MIFFIEIAGPSLLLQIPSPMRTVVIVTLDFGTQQAEAEHAASEFERASGRGKPRSSSLCGGPHFGARS